MKAQRKQKGKKSVGTEATFGVNVKVELSVEEHLVFERFALNIKMDCLRELKRKPAFGFQKLSALLVDLFLTDKEFRERMKLIIMEHYRTEQEA